MRTHERILPLLHCCQGGYTISVIVVRCFNHNIIETDYRAVSKLNQYVHSSAVAAWIDGTKTFSVAWHCFVLPAVAAIHCSVLFVQVIRIVHMFYYQNGVCTIPIPPYIEVSITLKLTLAVCQTKVRCTLHMFACAIFRLE